MARGKIDVDQVDWDEAIGEPVTINSTLTVSGSVSVSGSIYHNGDSDTFIKFTDDLIILKAGAKSMFRGDPANGQIYINNGAHDLDLNVRSASGASLLYTDAGNDRVGIGTSTPDYTLDVAGDIGVDQYIYHNGDADTLIRFTDNKIVLRAGNLAMVTAEKKGSSPHEVTINDGSNNVDFVVKGNGSGAGNPGMKFDASTNRLGINGVGSPEVALDIDSDAIRIRNDNTPSSASDFGHKGEIRWDANYIYICVATDTWKRVALSSW